MILFFSSKLSSSSETPILSPPSFHHLSPWSHSCYRQCTCLKASWAKSTTVPGFHSSFTFTGSRMSAPCSRRSLSWNSKPYIHHVLKVHKWPHTLFVGTSTCIKLPKVKYYYCSLLLATDYTHFRVKYVWICNHFQAFKRKKYLHLLLSNQIFDLK